MHGWEIKLVNAGRRKYRSYPRRVEARKHMPGADMLITVMDKPYFELSMNGVATISDTTLAEFGEVIVEMRRILNEAR